MTMPDNDQMDEGMDQRILIPGHGEEAKQLQTGPLW